MLVLFLGRIILQFSLSTLGIDITQWHDVQLEGVILNFVAPEAKIPDTAIIDFLVAISVLPMAAFTTISVLGGSNGIPSWMKNKENDLENLSQQSLPEPKEEEEKEILFKTTEPESEYQEEERMIDIPRELFE